MLKIKRQLLHLIRQRQPCSNQGFTLIELLVVIVILGILSALALPVYLSQAGKARQAGAETLIGKVNRSQQVYRVINGTFATNYLDLEDFNTLPDPPGYTFATTMTADANQAIVEVESQDLVSQPHLCGIANLNTTDIAEDSAFGDGSCP